MALDTLTHFVGLTILLLQECDKEIKGRRGFENKIVEYLSRLESYSRVGEQGQLPEEFPNEQLLLLDMTELVWLHTLLIIRLAHCFHRVQPHT